MIGPLIRVAIVILLFAIAVLLLSTPADAGWLTLLRQFVRWFWKLFLYGIKQAVSLFSKKAGIWLENFLRRWVSRFLWRKFLTPVILLALVFVVGRKRSRRLFALLRLYKTRLTKRLVQCWNYNPTLPTLLRVSLAVGVVALTIVGLVWVHSQLGSYAKYLTPVITIVVGQIIYTLPILGLEKMMRMPVNKYHHSFAGRQLKRAERYLLKKLRRLEHWEVRRRQQLRRWRQKRKARQQEK